MGELSAAIMRGQICAACCVLFVDTENVLVEHGYPVVCKDCWTDEEWGGTAYQKAIYGTLGDLLRNAKGVEE